MTLMAGILLFVFAVAMLLVARPADGESASFLKVWFIGQIYAMVTLVLGVTGVTMIISDWPF
ncbi:MAG TPA: hypothetical protein VFL51_17480 [Pseudolabrys sp.]|nr:hypothetical protein [Pseudolabrys sp.]